MNLYITSPQFVTHYVLCDMEKRHETNSYGERISRYHQILEDCNGATVAVQVTVETDGLESDEYHYSVHLVDNITMRDCQLSYPTKSLSKTELFQLIEKLTKESLDIIWKWDFEREGWDFLEEQNNKS